MAFFGLPANRWGALALGATLTFACSNVLGISSYEIDPSLDGQGGTGDDGPTGGKTTGGSNNPIGGEPSMGGEPNVGGAPSAGQGGTPEPVAGAGGSEPEPECRVTADCDDSIDCTTDTCAPNGTCVHVAKDAMCDGTLCETCQVGVGCVAGKSTVTQLLLDEAFDKSSMDWDESTSDTPNLLADAKAQTAPRSAKFGPAASMGMAQQYSDVYQWITIPKGTVALNLKGYYKLTPGKKAPADDFVLFAFYESGAVSAYTKLNQFFGDGGAQAAWKAFTFSVAPAVVKKMVENEYTFDIVGYTWDSVYYVDTLELNATVCE